MKYSIGELLDEGQIEILPWLSELPRYSFTVEATVEFFNHFRSYVFSFDQKVKSFVITEGLMKPPNLTSFANGYLFSYSIEELIDMGRWDPWAKAVGKIAFSHGAQGSYLKVAPLGGQWREVWPGRI